MYRNVLVGSVALVLAGAVQPAAAIDPLGAGNGAIFRLSEKSVFEEGCYPPCLCPILDAQPAHGTFKLIYEGAVEGIETYRIEDVNWVVPTIGAERRIIGEGKYQVGSPGVLPVIEQRMELMLQVDDDKPQRFDSGWHAVESNAGIHITVSMNDKYCWDRAIFIDARRVPEAEIFRHTLEMASTYQHGCFDPCDCPLEDLRRMVGDFAMVPIGSTDWFQWFAFVDVCWEVHSPEASAMIPISGYGIYGAGGDFALQHRLSMDLIVGDNPRAHFDSGWVTPTVMNVALEITVSMNAMVCLDTVLHIVAVPATGKVCGGLAGIQCDNPDTEFCKLPIGGCCCDFQGVCTPMPTACPEHFDPVCGCDGVTYGNDCEADAAGVSIAHWGECRIPCGGLNSFCPAGQFCKFPVGACEPALADGVCMPMPEVCITLWDPVCGCDGVTYGNECEADAAGALIAHWGACPIGACCMADPTDVTKSCIATTHHKCLEIGGTYLGDGTECPADPTQPCGHTCPVACPTGMPCVVAWGTLFQGEGCILFEVDTGAWQVFALENLGGCGVGDYVFVTGCIDSDCVSNCQAFSGGCIVHNTIGPCGQTCGGLAGIPCDNPDDFCKFPKGTCGDGDIPGICTTPPNGCTREYLPVCGCDGVTYSNACEADSAGVSVVHQGVCDPGVCCADIAGSPLPVPVCTESTREECSEPGGTYMEGPDTCMPREACCLPLGSVNTHCVETDPRCCIAFGGRPLGPESTCIRPDGTAECDRSCGGFSGGVCLDTEFCKYPVGICSDAVDHQGVCTVIPGGGCPEYYDPVCGCDGVTYGNECMSDAAGVSILHHGVCEGGDCSAKRVLSDPEPSYCPATAKTVHIALSIPTGTDAISVEDAPPTGWVVSNISKGGSYTVNGNVRWGPLFAPFPVELTYDVIPPSTDDGTKCFVGEISIDGINEGICGDRCLDRFCCPAMQPDLPQPACDACPGGDCTTCEVPACNNGQVNLCELTRYACAWLKGCNDDMSGMTRAAYIWRNGECFCWDDAQRNWYPATCSFDRDGCCDPTDSPTGGGASAWQLEGATVARIDQASPRRVNGLGKAFSVWVTLEPLTGATAAALEVQLPVGWKVGTISDNGEWDRVNRKVKWGPFFEDLGRTVMFEVNGVGKSVMSPARGVRQVRPVGRLSGTVSFDGINQPITIE